jgi:hypothetical protein
VSRIGHHLQYYDKVVWYYWREREEDRMANVNGEFTQMTPEEIMLHGTVWPAHMLAHVQIVRLWSRCWPMPSTIRAH